ncbi:MAG: DUF2461 domain-containing protein [Bacteroidales bacterium]|nr:DUF2461 domain-containing protein [Bacteroidales bacterium]
MENGIKPQTFHFLELLKENNNRDWFLENKKLYDDAKADFESFVQSLIAGINEFDPDLGFPEPKDCIFRIFRDVRFSNNKQPYKNNFGAYVAPGGRKSPLAAYYFHVEPGGSFLSGGVYMAQADAMRRIREDILDYSDDFLSIVNAKDFATQFTFTDSEMLKRNPTGFPKETPVDFFLKLKHITPWKELSDTDILNPDLRNHALKAYKSLKPLLDFLNRAIKQ